MEPTAQPASLPAFSPYVIVATKGRAKETKILLDYLRNQTLPPVFTLIVGAGASDIAGLQEHALISGGHAEAVISPRVGASAQRNFGLESLVQKGMISEDRRRAFYVFFDDDYRPERNWLQSAAERLAKSDIVGLTGKVLADGVKSGGLSESQAADFLDGKTPPQAHWAAGGEEREVDSAYGCNMAFAAIVARRIRFDEKLPLYSWQEDRDYTGMAKKYGRVIYTPRCRGVHLGAKSGRQSGLRFGYSQIANPLYLMRKGTMGRGPGIEHMLRNFASNLIRTLSNSRPDVDYPGRLRGNLRAIKDALLLRSDPRRILDKDFQP